MGKRSQYWRLHKHPSISETLSGWSTVSRSLPSHRRTAWSGMTADGHNVPWLFLPDPNLNCDQIVAILPNTQSNGMHSILKGSQCTNFRVPNISSWLKSREPFAANKSGISCDMPSTFNAFRRCHCFCRHHCYLHWCCLMHSSKLFESISSNENHRLYKLLPSRNKCHFNLRHKRNFNIPMAKTKRLMNTFIYSNCN